MALFVVKAVANASRQRQAHMTLSCDRRIFLHHSVCAPTSELIVRMSQSKTGRGHSGKNDTATGRKKEDFRD